MATSIGSISSAGIGSGLDVAGIISKLMAVESQPLTQLKSTASAFNTQLSTFGQLQGYMSALQTRANALTSLTLWNGSTASSSDASSVSASTGANATAGNYAVSVQSLASVQTVTAAALASSSSTLGAGSLTIGLGTWTGVPATGFTASASAPVTVTIAATDTL
jgi:flagellar hook-associated protein 2